MWMFRSELKRTDHEINPCTCAVACLPGILVVCPQAIAVHLSSVGPIGELGLLLAAESALGGSGARSDLISCTDSIHPA